MCITLSIKKFLHFLIINFSEFNFLSMRRKKWFCKQILSPNIEHDKIQSDNRFCYIILLTCSPVPTPKKKEKKREEWKRISGAYSILGVEAGMNDSIHIKVEVIVFHAIRVGLGGIDGDLDAIDLHRLLFDHVHHHHRVLLRQPPVERRNPHGSLSRSRSPLLSLARSSKRRALDRQMKRRVSETLDRWRPEREEKREILFPRKM